MAKLLHVVLVLVALCSYSLARHHHLKEAEKEDGAASRSLDQHTAPKKATAASTEESTESTEGSTEGSSSTSSNSEGKAGEAIKTLLQEKITQKFKEAANEVKGVLVKQLGDSLKSAHDVFNPPKTVDMKKAAGVTSQKVAVGKAGAAAIHQNKGPRHRKNSGPQGTPGKTHHTSSHHNHAPSVSHGLPMVQSAPPPIILSTRSSAVNQALAERAAAMQDNKPVGTPSLQFKQPIAPLLPPIPLAAAAVPQQRPAIVPAQLTQRMVPNYNPAQAIPPRVLTNYVQRLAPQAATPVIPAAMTTLTPAQKADTPGVPAAAAAAPIGPNSPGVQHVYLPMEVVQAPPGWPPQSIVPNTGASSPVTASSSPVAVSTRTPDAASSNPPMGNNHVGGAAPVAAAVSGKVESSQSTSSLPAISSISVPSD